MVLLTAHIATDVLPRDDFEGPGAPLTGVSTGVVRALTGIGKGVVGGPITMVKDVRKHTTYERKKRLRRKSKSKTKTEGALDDRAVERSEKTEHIPSESDSHTSDEYTSSYQRKDGKGKMSNALPESTQNSGNIAEDLKDAAARDNDLSRPQAQHADSQLSVISGAPSGNLAVELAHDAAIGVARPLEAIAEGNINSPPANAPRADIFG